MKWLGLALVSAIAIVAYFIGREIERERLAESLDRTEQLVIHGTGGRI